MTSKYRRLVRAHATKVLGIYDHRVSFVDDEPYVILYGENGVGKTKFLELIYACANLEWRLQVTIPFESVHLYFDDETELCADRSPTENDGIFDYKITYSLLKGGRLLCKWSPVLDPMYERYIMRYGLRSIGHNEWVDDEGDVINDDEIFMRTSPRRRGAISKTSEEVPDMFRSFSEEFRCAFVNVQRLRSHESSHRQYFDESRARVRNHNSRNEDIASVIRRCLNEAQTENSKISQELDRSFPKRVLEDAESHHEYDQRKLQEAYESYNQIRRRIGKIFEMKEDQSLSLPLGELADWQLTLLSLYIEDTERKLAPLVDILKRVELLENLINRRFSGKQLKATDEDGLVVRLENSNQTIRLDRLSSGEQHEIVMFAELLFGAEDGVLVLIDEPEISLHIAWQLHYVDDLKKVAELTNSRFILATHSPQIINEDWDHAVRLGNGHLST